MEIRSRAQAEPFTTTDGSTIRSLLDRSNAPVAHQSLAEATIEAGETTVRHHHRESEEIYYLVEGAGEMEIDGERARVTAGDAVLIPPGPGTGSGPTPAGRCACCARARPPGGPTTPTSDAPRPPIGGT